LAAERFLPLAGAFFLAAGRFTGRFRALGGGGLAAVPPAVSANDTWGASAKSSGGGELTPSSLMTVRPFLASEAKRLEEPVVAALPLSVQQRAAGEHVAGGRHGKAARERLVRP